MGRADLLYKVGAISCVCIATLSCEDKSSDPSFMQDYVLLKEQSAAAKAQLEGKDREISRIQGVVADRERRIAELESKLLSGETSSKGIDSSKIFAGLFSKVPSFKQEVLNANPGCSVVKDPQLGVNSIDVNYPFTAPFEYTLSSPTRGNFVEVWLARGSLGGEWKLEKSDRVVEVQSVVKSKPVVEPDPVDEPKPIEKKTVADVWPPTPPSPWMLTRSNETFAVYVNSSTGQHKILQKGSPITW